MLDLSEMVNKVFTSRTVEEKKSYFTSMVNNSHAKTTTKNIFLSKIESLTNGQRIDKLAVDYMLSGEGIKVI